MDFLKKHYEKVLLGVVLLGLVAGLIFLLFKISSDKQAVEDKISSLIPKSVKPLTNLDMTLPEAALKRASVAASVSFGPPNKLFNPMPWQQKTDGTLLPAASVGAAAATITNIVPLRLILSLDSVMVSADGTAKYVIGIEKQTAPTTALRAKRTSYCKLNDKDKDNTFQLIEVKGKPEDPDQVILLLLDSGEKAVVSKDKDKPFTRIDGYMASINYEPENRKWKDQRLGAKLTFNGEDYIVVAISQNEVVLSAKSNQKKWTIKYNAALNNAAP